MIWNIYTGGIYNNDLEALIYKDGLNQPKWLTEAHLMYFIHDSISNQCL